MSAALFLTHRTQPGRRDDVERVWRAHMPAAIEANDGHEAYFYCYADDPDTIVVFQQYADDAAAQGFLSHPAYLAYLTEVEPLLAGPSQLTRAITRWSKGR